MVQVTGTLYSADGNKLKSATGFAVLSESITIGPTTFQPQMMPFTVSIGSVIGLNLASNGASNKPNSYYTVNITAGADVYGFKMRIPTPGTSFNIQDIILFDTQYTQYDYVLQQDLIYQNLIEDQNDNAIADVLELGLNKFQDVPRATFQGSAAILDGVATEYFTALPYLPGSLRAYVNGLLSIEAAGITEGDNLLGEFEFTGGYIPTSTDDVKLIYSYLEV